MRRLMAGSSSATGLGIAIVVNTNRMGDNILQLKRKADAMEDPILILVRIFVLTLTIMLSLLLLLLFKRGAGVGQRGAGVGQRGGGGGGGVAGGGGCARGGHCGRSRAGQQSKQNPPKQTKTT
eukprot:8654373-Heterocapsa_arctica.AAC.1